MLPFWNDVKARKQCWGPLDFIEQIEERSRISEMQLGSRENVVKADIEHTLMALSF